MNRSPLMDRFGLRGKARNKLRGWNARLGLEQLEERRLLSGSDLLISTVDGTINGDSVLRYNEAAEAPVPGSVATGAYGGLVYYVTGLAVAPDSSYYVSCYASDSILHFSDSGTLLGILWSADPQTSSFFPGTLLFGPNGNLYAGNFAGNDLYEFNTSTQHQVATISLPSGFTSTGGFAFAADGDLFAGDLTTGDVEYLHAGAWTPLTFPQGLIVVPYAMLALSDGDVLIANGYPDATYSCNIMDYNTTNGVNPDYITLTEDSGMGQNDYGYPAAPTALQLDASGDLLVGLAPSESGDGDVLQFNLQTSLTMPTATIAAGIGAPSGLGLVLPFMSIAATNWTNAGPAGLTLTQTNDGMLHVNDTGGANDVISPLPLDNVGQVQIAGLDNAAGALTIDFTHGSPIPAGGVAFTSGASSGTNTVTISGSSDPSATIQTRGEVSFGQGGMSSGTPSNSYTIESGTVDSLSTSGGLNKTGPGTLVIDGSNSYGGGTTVAGGTLAVTASGRLPSGSSLTVGTNASSIFGPSTAAQAAPVISSSNAAASAAPVAASTAAAFAPAALLPAMPAASSSPASAVPASKGASDSGGSSFGPAIGAAAAPASRAAGVTAWWNSAAPSSESEGSTAGNDPRLAALDAYLTEYGKS